MDVEEARLIRKRRAERGREMSFIPKPHEIYRHFKGSLYQITAIAEHTETGEQLVVYQALYGDFRTYARPLSMFTEVLDRERYPDAEQMFRFELQGPDAARQKESLKPDGQAGGRAKGEESAIRTVGAETALPDGGRHADGDSASLTDTEGAFRDSEQEEVSLDPLVLEFLDSDSYEQRLNILAGLHHRITDDMITTMAIACDVEINDGDLEERYEALKTCLLTLERYECNRLR